METVTPLASTVENTVHHPLPSTTTIIQAKSSTILAKNETIKNAEPTFDGLSFHEEASMRAFMFGDGPNPKTVRLVRAFSQPIGNNNINNNNNNSSKHSSAASPVLLARIGYFAPTFDQNGLQSGLEWFDGIRLIALSPRFIESIGFDGSALRIKLSTSIENGKTIWFSPLPRLDESGTEAVSDHNGSIPLNPSYNTPASSENVNRGQDNSSSNAVKDAEAWSIFAHACAASFLSYWQERINRRDAASNNRNNKNGGSKKNESTVPIMSSIVPPVVPSVPTTTTITNNKTVVTTNSVPVTVTTTTDPGLPHGTVPSVKGNDNETYTPSNDNDDNVSLTASRSDSAYGNASTIRLPTGQIVPARKDRAGMSRKEYRQMLLERNSTQPRTNDTVDSTMIISNDSSSNTHPSTVNPSGNNNTHNTYNYPPPSHSTTNQPYPNAVYDETLVSHRGTDVVVLPQQQHRVSSSNSPRAPENSTSIPRNSNIRSYHRSSPTAVIPNTGATQGNGSLTTSMYLNHRNNNDPSSSSNMIPSMMDSNGNIMATPPLPSFDQVTPVHIHKDYSTHPYATNSTAPREYYSPYAPPPTTYSPYPYNPSNIPLTHYSPMNMVPINYNTNVPINYNPAQSGLTTMSLVQLPNGMMGMMIPTSTGSSSNSGSAMSTKK